jgi:hypothetical protein
MPACSARLRLAKNFLETNVCVKSREFIAFHDSRSLRSRLFPYGSLFDFIEAALL